MHYLSFACRRAVRSSAVLYVFLSLIWTFMTTFLSFSACLWVSKHTSMHCTRAFQRNHPQMWQAEMEYENAAAQTLMQRGGGK